MSAFHRILVPVDGSSTSDKAVAQAARVAKDAGAKLLLIHAADALAYLTGFEASADVLRLVREGGEKVLAQASAIAQQGGIEPQTRFIDVPGQRLGQTVADAARSWDADLIVVGTHGRRGVQRLVLGSGAEEIIRLAPVAVLVVRGE